MHAKCVYWSSAGLLDGFTLGADIDTLKAEATALFAQLDENKKGAINKAELMKGFPQLDDQTAELLLAEADADNDGSISFDELFAVIQEASRDGAKPEANAAGQTETELLQSRIAKLEAEVLKRDALIKRLKTDLAKARILNKAEAYKQDTGIDTQVYTGLG